MEYGCCLNMLSEGPDGIGLEHIDIFSNSGYDYVELPLAEMMALSEGAFAKLWADLQASQIPCRCCNNFFPKTMRLTGPDVDQAAIDRYVAQALRLADRLGSRTIVFGSGGAKHVPEGFPMEKGYEQVVRLLRRIDREAAGYGITIVIEPLRKAECNLINTFEEGCQLAGAVGGRHVKVLVDHYHLTEEQEPLSHLLKNGKKWLHHVHFANPEVRIFPRSADEDGYTAFFQTLRAIGYEGTVSIEAYSQSVSKDAPAALLLLKNALGPSTSTC